MNSHFHNMNDLSWHLAHEALTYMAKNGPSVSAKEVYGHIHDIVDTLDLSEHIPERYKSHKGPSYIIAMNFKLVGYAKAGFIKKSSPRRGYWTITEKGIEIANSKKTPEEIQKYVDEAYVVWRKDNDANQKLNSSITTTEEAGEIDLTIRDVLLKLDPYEFQDLTAGLLEGMGYFVDFNAPRGKDGGVDLVCYKDPLGAEIPRIKVQCKHMPEAKISRGQIAQFAGVINTNDEIGIFVTSGFYSNDAKRYAIEKNVHIRLIDGQELEDMWTKYYNNIPSDKQMLLPILFVPQYLSEES